jgi:hypothetical protein
MKKIGFLLVIGMVCDVQAFAQTDEDANMASYKSCVKTMPDYLLCSKNDKTRSINVDLLALKLSDQKPSYVGLVSSEDSWPTVTSIEISLDRVTNSMGEKFPLVLIPCPSPKNLNEIRLFEYDNVGHLNVVPTQCVGVNSPLEE